MPALIVVLGPTGAGKSSLALHLARALHAEIVNCDSVQVYRGLDIGSAKLPPAARAGVPHHLLDILDPREELTAGAYSTLARAVLNELAARSVLPIVAGGTGFYLRALFSGLSPAPPRDSRLRARLTSVAARRSAVLHRFLRRYDAPSAARIHANDHQKLIRAIELTLVAHEPASRLQSRPRLALPGYRVLRLGLDPPRAALREAIDRRTEEMFCNGLIDETRALLASGVPPNAKSLGTLGYKQAVAHLSGEISLAEAVLDCQTKTRQYAKRQMTWFRNEPLNEPGIVWLLGFGHDPAIEQQALAHAIDFLARVDD